jgi:hypothetical protein
MCERKYTASEQTTIDRFKLNHPHVCYYCSNPITVGNVVTVDHKMPVCKGGLTTEDNLVISCLKCNQEKDDMTLEEYLVYKQKQQEINDNEVTQFISEMIRAYNDVSSRGAEISFRCTEVDKKINQLQQDIMLGEHNACEGYKLTMILKELLLEKETLKIMKTSYTHLNALLGNHRKQLLETEKRIHSEINSNNKLFLKKYAVSKCRSKVVSINRLMQSAR